MTESFYRDADDPSQPATAAWWFARWHSGDMTRRERRAFARAQEQAVLGPRQQTGGKRMQQGVEGGIAVRGGHPRSVARCQAAPLPR